jgi:glutamate/tyrosine decarboxylase-like PLP-dependent enzyme
MTSTLDQQRVKTSVDPSALHRFDEDSAELAEKIVDYALMRARHGDEHLITPPSAAMLDEALAGAISEQGVGFERAFSLVTDVIAPNCQSPDHPRFLAFVAYAPATSGVLMDLALSASGIFGTSWLEAAGATAAENQALRWLADLAGMPATAGGTFVSGGTIANVNGLAVARDAWRHRHGDSGRRVAVAASEEVHSSVRLAAKVLEIDVVDVPTDERGRLTGANLAGVLDATAAEVCAVAATGGITNLGIVDDLAGIADVARARGLWLHVDAAYGGAALVSKQARDLFAGIEHSDSLVVDPHKWLFAPLDCSAIIYREPALAQATFTQSAAYIEAFQETAEVNPGDLAVQLTRRARGLPFWFTLASHGTAAFVPAVEHGLALAKETARLIERTSGLELTIEPELSVVVFRRHGWSAPDYRAWCDRHLAEGTAFVLPTTWRGESLMRFCFVNPRTTLDDVQRLIDSLAAGN